MLIYISPHQSFEIKAPRKQDEFLGALVTVSCLKYEVRVINFLTLGAVQPNFLSVVVYHGETLVP